MQRKLTAKRTKNISAPTAAPTQKPRNSFPAWRLPNGTINATEAQLESASSSCERWEWGCAGLVAVAIAAEFVIAWVHPSYDSILERWGSVLADLLIFAGVVGEVIFSRKDARIQTELRKRSNDKLESAIKAAGEAHERAANAELETQKLKRDMAWRTLDALTSATLMASLRDAGAASVIIAFLGNDPESHNFVSYLTIVFELAGWRVSHHAGLYAGITFGIWIPDEPNRPDEMREVSQRVQNAFSKAGISFFPKVPPQAQFHIETGDPMFAPIAWMYVGPKPMPLP